MKRYLNDNSKFSYFVGIIFIICAVFLLFRKLLVGEIIATNDLGTNDLLFQYFPARTLYTEALKNGEILQWTPLVYSGFPIFAEGQNSYLYPLNIALCYLLNPFQAMNWFIILHAIIFGIGVYIFTTKITGSSWSSIASGVAGSICGSIIAGHTRHLNVLAIICLSPWLFIFAESYVRKFKIKYALLFGMVLGLMLLIGHPQSSFIAGSLAGIYIIARYYYILKHEKTEKFSKQSKVFIFSVRTLGIFILIAILTALIISYAQIRDTLELASLTKRGEGEAAEFVGMGSMPWEGILTFIYPYFLGNAGDNTFKLQQLYMFWEMFMYTGITTFIIAIVGIVSFWKHNFYVRIFVIIFVISYLLSLGDNFPLYKIFGFIPYVQSFRFPVRWLVGAEISILILSGFGVIAIRDRFIHKKEISKSKVKLKKITTQNRGKLRIREYLSERQYLFGLIFSIIIVIDIYFVAGRQVETADKSVFFREYVAGFSRDEINEYNRMLPIGEIDYFITAFKRSKGWEGDKRLYTIGTILMPPNLSAYYHIPTIRGYTQLVPTYIVEVWGDALNRGLIGTSAYLKKDLMNFETMPSFIKLARMWGVRNLMTIWNLKEPFKYKWDSLGVIRYELPDAFPRSWVVKNTILAPKDKPKLSAGMLIDEKFNPREDALITDDVPKLPEDAQSGSAEIIESKNHLLKIRALVPGLVIVNDTWYPRWKARVDGVESKIYRVNNMMRGIVAPKAGSEIEMYYDEGNLGMFLMLSLLVQVFIIIYSIIKCKR